MSDLIDKYHILNSIKLHSTDTPYNIKKNPDETSKIINVIVGTKKQSKKQLKVQTRGQKSKQKYKQAKKGGGNYIYIY